MFGKYFLKVPGGHLSPKDQDNLIKYVLANVSKPAARELRMVLDGSLSVDRLSAKTLKGVRSVAYRWLIAHNS